MHHATPHTPGWEGGALVVLPTVCTLGVARHVCSCAVEWSATVPVHARVCRRTVLPLRLGVRGCAFANTNAARAAQLAGTRTGPNRAWAPSLVPLPWPHSRRWLGADPRRTPSSTPAVCLRRADRALIMCRRRADLAGRADCVQVPDGHLHPQRRRLHCGTGKTKREWWRRNRAWVIFLASLACLHVPSMGVHRTGRCANNLEPTATHESLNGSWCLGE